MISSSRLRSPSVRNMNVTSTSIFDVFKDKKSRCDGNKPWKLRALHRSGYSLCACASSSPPPISYFNVTHRGFFFSSSWPSHFAKPGMKSPISSASKTLFNSVRGPYSLSVVARYSCLFPLGFVGVFRLRKLHLLLDLLSAVDGTAVSS